MEVMFKEAVNAGHSLLKDVPTADDLEAGGMATNITHSR